MSGFSLPRGMAMGYVAIAATMLLTGCGLGKPVRILTQPPAPAVTGPAIPVTPVRQPLSLAGFKADPCRVLNREQIAATVIDPPDHVTPARTNDVLGTGCLWMGLDTVVIKVSVPERGWTNLGELTIQHQHGDLEPWQETSLAGFPVVIYHEVPAPEFCDVGIGVSDTEMVHVDFGSGGHVPSQYWQNNECGGALKTAAFVLDNLRRH